MRECRENGVQLGWLIVPERRQVWRYARGSDTPTCLTDPASLGDEAILPGLTIDLMRIWQSGF
jgi:Uma2 family endonuclease